VLRVGTGLSLEEVHNLQYSNRLSYLIEASQRKCPKGKNTSQLQKLAELEIQRIEHLYEQYFADISFLQEVQQQYLNRTAEL
jgi:hypothetical protein